MGRTVEYRGYAIESAPRYVPEWEKWQLRILVSFDGHRGVQTRECSSEILYATEQEAEIRGIALAQRLIDGKVAGWTVADLEVVDQPDTFPRVQFRTTSPTPMKLEGRGVLLDLSTDGCRVKSPVTVEPGVTLGLHIFVPDLNLTLMVEAASVRWVSGQIFGLAFVRVGQTEQELLNEAVVDLSDGRATE
jgi:hypothetical protein